MKNMMTKLQSYPYMQVVLIKNLVSLKIRLLAFCFKNSGTSVRLGMELGRKQGQSLVDLSGSRANGICLLSSPLARALVDKLHLYLFVLVLYRGKNLCISRY